jgi:hypothetical protein
MIFMDSKPFHLVVRFSDTMFSAGDVVDLHNAIVKKQGVVWFGKLGQALSQKRADLLNKQVEKKIPTFLYLVKGHRSKSTAYRAKLIHIQREKPLDNVCIPNYYIEKDMIQYMKVWIKISKISQISMSEMENLKTVNSVLPIAETLKLSSSGHFLVHESKSIL